MVLEKKNGPGQIKLSSVDPGHKDIRKAIDLVCNPGTGRCEALITTFATQLCTGTCISFEDYKKNRALENIYLTNRTLCRPIDIVHFALT